MNIINMTFKNLPFEIQQEISKHLGPKNRLALVSTNKNTYTSSIGRSARPTTSGKVAGPYMFMRTNNTVAMNARKDEAAARAIVDKINSVIEAILSCTFRSRTKTALKKEIEPLGRCAPGLVGISVGSTNNAAFTVEFGNDGVSRNDPMRLSNIRRNGAGGSQRINEARAFVVGGYRLRLRVAAKFVTANGSFQAISVAVKTVVVTKPGVPAEVLIHGGRPSGRDAWFDERGMGKWPQVIPVWAAGIMVDAMIRGRPSRPKFHVHNLKIHDPLATNTVRVGSKRKRVTLNQRNNSNQNMNGAIQRLIRVLQAMGYMDPTAVYDTHYGKTNVAIVAPPQHPANNNPHEVWDPNNNINNGWHSNHGNGFNWNSNHD